MSVTRLQAGHVGGGVLGEKGKQEENPSSGRQACCGREGKAGKTLLAWDVDCCRWSTLGDFVCVLSSGGMSRVFSHDASDGMSQLGLGRRELQFHMAVDAGLLSHLDFYLFCVPLRSSVPS